MTLNYWSIQWEKMCDYWKDIIKTHIVYLRILLDSDLSDRLALLGLVTISEYIN